MQAAMTGAEQSYAGDVSVTEAWEQLQKNAAAQLVDVRTKPEWTFVGLPDLTALQKTPIQLSWQVYPDMKVNPTFADELREQGIKPGEPVYFLCRSGARSRAAAIAMTAAGFGPCYNVAGGFEGDLDATKRRGRQNGWKASGLAWFQS